MSLSLTIGKFAIQRYDAVDGDVAYLTWDNANSQEQIVIRGAEIEDVIHILKRAKADRKADRHLKQK